MVIESDQQGHAPNPSVSTSMSTHNTASQQHLDQQDHRAPKLAIPTSTSAHNALNPTSQQHPTPNVPTGFIHQDHRHSNPSLLTTAPLHNNPIFANQQHPLTLNMPVGLHQAAPHHQRDGSGFMMQSWLNEGLHEAPWYPGCRSSTSGASDH